nr:hypothetical protein [Candidatus Sigynarchaeota archaeon]
MEKTKSHFTIFENKQLKYKRLGLTSPSQIKSFKRKIKSLNRHFKKKKQDGTKQDLLSSFGRGETGLFKFLNKGIKATQFVGVARISNKTITVLPKIFSPSKITKPSEDKAHDEIDANTIKDNIRVFMYMLDVAHFFKNIKQLPVGSFDKIKEMFEFIIRIFANNLFDELKRGVANEYITIEENRPYLKGKLIIKKQILFNVVNKARFYCEHDEYFCNTILNQAFKQAATILHVVTRVSGNKRILGYIINMLEDVDNRHLTPAELNRVKFSRTSERFKPDFTIASQIIQNATYLAVKGKLETFSFMFDMNLLFERFIAQVIQRHSDLIFEGRKINNITNQHHDLHLFKDKENNKAIFLKPDIFIEFDNLWLIIDTKYKKINDENGIKHNITPRDAYQVYAYYHAYLSQLIEKNKSKPLVKILLLYPFHLDNTFAYDPFINKYTFSCTSYFKDSLAIPFSNDVQIYVAVIELKCNENAKKNCNAYSLSIAEKIKKIMQGMK